MASNVFRLSRNKKIENKQMLMRKKKKEKKETLNRDTVCYFKNNEEFPRLLQAQLNPRGCIFKNQNHSSQRIY